MSKYESTNECIHVKIIWTYYSVNSTWNGSWVLGVLSFWILPVGPTVSQILEEKYQVKFALQKYLSGNHQPQEKIPFSVIPLTEDPWITDMFHTAHSRDLRMCWFKNVISSHWWSHGPFIFPPLQDFSSEFSKTIYIFVSEDLLPTGLFNMIMTVPLHPFLFYASWIHLTCPLYPFLVYVYFLNSLNLSTSEGSLGCPLYVCQHIVHKLSLVRIKSNSCLFHFTKVLICNWGFKKSWLFMTNSLRSISLNVYIPPR